ncbi:MAG: hypothetical protein JWL90_2726 [Chthoniobacteraceae bacterium]|nr:hypothetical protein [Chthoniobacteraceae bacterium]MDB6171007.1 hypothetical protein [Chthoniobacteraceae bacterium]
MSKVIKNLEGTLGVGNLTEQGTAQNVRVIANLERAAEASQCATDRVAGVITRFCGSMIFVWVHVVWFTGWILWNTVAPARHLDPFPFSFLTLVVSLEAIFLSTFILISENREGRINERRSRLDLQINLLAEQENTKMLELLREIAAKVGVASCNDPALAALAQPVHPEQLLKQIDECVDEQDAAAARP